MPGTNYKFLLQFQCDQDVNEMPLKENATKRYCRQCDRNLVDFRNHSMEQILQYKKSLKGEKFCGIFGPDHVRTEIIIQPRFESHKTVFSNSFMVLAALSLLTSCQTENPSQKNTEKRPNENTRSDSTPLTSPSKDSSTVENSTTSDTLKTCLPDRLYPIPPEINPPEPFVGIEMEPEPYPEPIEDTFYLEPNPETIYDIVEKMPQFPGGEKKMIAYLQNEIRYPLEAKEKGIQGTVYIRFVINENGDIIDPVILKTPDRIFDEPSLSVIRRMPKWFAGEEQGKKVKVRITLPIRYKL